MNNSKIRCKCSVCGSTQMVKIGEYITGVAKCWRGLSLSNQEPCNGALEYCSENMEDSMLNTSALLYFLRDMHFDNPKLTELIDTVAGDFGIWAEGEQSPRDMGWVNDKGLP